MYQRLTFTSPVFTDHGKQLYAAIADQDGMATAAKAFNPRNDVDRSWTGGMGYSEALRAAWSGDLAAVAESDSLLDEFSDLTMSTRRWQTIDAVAGGAPNVGAFLAGTPMAMRRRQRQLSQGAPLTVFVDLVSSVDIKAPHLKKRGVACLALVRALSASRPVTVYGVAGGNHKTDGTNGAAFVMIRLESPLDLSRAAFFLAHPAAARGIAYAALHDGIIPGTNTFNGEWAWNDHDKYLRFAAQCFAAIVNAPIEDCLYLAPPHLNDPAITQPAQWVKDMLAKHGGAPIQSDA